MYKFHCTKCGREFSTAQLTNTVTCPFCGQQFITTQPQQQGQGWGEPQQPQQPPIQGQGWGEAQGQSRNQYAYGAPQPQGVFDAGPSGKSRGLAGLFAILFGALGVHYFYIGKTTGGLVFLLVTLLSCGILGAVVGLIALIQGIIFLTQTQEEFERKYVNSVSSIPLF